MRTIEKKGIRQLVRETAALPLALMPGVGLDWDVREAFPVRTPIGIAGHVGYRVVASD